MTGIDVDPAVVRTATELSDGIEFRCGDLMTAELPGQHDVVTALAVLHHVPLEAGLVRLRDLVAPGGTLVVLGVPSGRGFTDRCVDVVAIPANLAMGALHTRRRGSAGRPVAMTAPTAPATASLAQVREVARHVVPGARVRRHLFWRYSLVWSAPAGGELHNPRSLRPGWSAGRGPEASQWNFRSESAMATSLMLAWRWVMSPSSSKRQFSLP